MSDVPAATQAIPLSKKSDEYTRIAYMLQLALRSNDVEDVRVWKVENPHLGVQFQKRTAGMLVLDAWVDATTLGEQNAVQSVFSRGFKFPASGAGMGFTHGNCHLGGGGGGGGGAAQAAAAAGGAHQFLYTQIGVGRSFVMDDPAAKKVLPPGYDSIYIQRNLDRDGDGKFSMEEYAAAASHDARGAQDYEHEYMLLDPTQVCARYLVEFFYTPGAAARRAAAASNAAASDDPEAMYDRFDFFDPVLYQPVSFRDKMVGTHSQGEPATHKLIAIADAHDTARAASERQDPVLLQRTQQLAEKLKAVDRKLREVNKNSAAVEESIYQMLQEALFQLQDETQRKMNILLGEELELRRQQEQIGWAETFLAEQRATAAAPEFLDAWKNHLQLRDALHAEATSQPSVLDGVHADLRLEGTVAVSSASESALASAAARPSGAGAAVGGSGFAAAATGGGMAPPAMAAPQGFAQPSPAQAQQQQQQQQQAQPPASPFATAGMASALPSSAGGSVRSVPASPALSSVGATPATAAMPAAAAPPMSATPAAAAAPADASATAARFAQYSLRQQAERRMRQLNAAPNPAAHFPGSQIISGDDAASLYFCLPFSSNVPETALLYASWRHAPGVPTLQQYCMETYAPSVLLVRSGDYVFGGYATDAWNADGVRFGSPKCFLFSVTHDRKIPFHGRTRDAKSQTRAQVDAQGYPLPMQHDCLEGSVDAIQFGIHDLVLRGDFSECSASLEGSYGFGLAPGSAEANTFLAGGQTFKADAVEVWQVQ